MSEKKFIIETLMLADSSIYLCPVSPEDVDSIYQLRSNPIVNQYIDRKPCESIEEAMEFIHMIRQKSISGEVIYWTIKMKDTNKLSGTICVFKFMNEDQSCEIGYELLPAYHGKGIMSEALNIVLEFCKNELFKKNVLAEVLSTNEKSLILLKKFDFSQIGEKNEDGYLTLLKKM